MCGLAAVLGSTWAFFQWYMAVKDTDLKSAPLTLQGIFGGAFNSLINFHVFLLSFLWELSFLHMLLVCVQFILCDSWHQYITISLLLTSEQSQPFCKDHFARFIWVFFVSNNCYGKQQHTHTHTPKKLLTVTKAVLG